jgi:pSer/pThr/pTyr-binding forkhead associated (FHA) protein
MSRQADAPDRALSAVMRLPSAQAFAIVLKPLSRTGLGDIQINDALFAVGRAEAPFLLYPPDAIAELSRRHARIFAEHGVAYLADLGSKNGTAVNGTRVNNKIVALHDGDQLCFGRSLAYQVQIQGRSAAPTASAIIRSVTLSPQRAELGLQAIVIEQFPFLISKADPTFAQYRDAFPHQVNYLSRRHAHVFLKGGVPWIEDLGSTNGTFVGDKRLGEKAVALEEGATVGFGGHHFVYQVSLQTMTAQSDPTMTQFLAAPLPGSGDDKTTFVASADSFLDIFCVEPVPQQADEINTDLPMPQADGSNGSARGRKLSSTLIALARSAIKSRPVRWGAVACAVLIVLAVTNYLNGAPEREIRDLLANGATMQAANLANAQLQHSPGDTAARTLATEASLKAVVPDWSRSIKAGQFSQAANQLAALRRFSASNPDLQSISRVLEWITGVEQFVAARGGADKAIADAADEQKVRLYLKQWEDDKQDQQRVFLTVSAIVPEFKDTYASALSHVRKLALLGGNRGDQ